jgi:CspA family cold shock protein
MDADRKTGTVKWFSRVKGYGFVAADGEEREIFVHFTGIEGEGFRNLEKGQRVSFVVEQTEKGPQAAQVREELEGPFSPDDVPGEGVFTPAEPVLTEEEEESEPEPDDMMEVEPESEDEMMGSETEEGFEEMVEDEAEAEDESEAEDEAETMDESEAEAEAETMDDPDTEDGEGEDELEDSEEEPPDIIA